MIIIFWTLVAALAFALALATQMRLLLSIVLRRALAAKFGGKHTDATYRAAITDAGRKAPDTDEMRHLMNEYSTPVSHLTLARRTGLFSLAMLPLVFLTGRYLLRII